MNIINNIHISTMFMLKTYKQGYSTSALRAIINHSTSFWFVAAHRGIRCFPLARFGFVVSGARTQTWRDLKQCKQHWFWRIRESTRDPSRTLPRGADRIYIYIYIYTYIYIYIYIYTRGPSPSPSPLDTGVCERSTPSEKKKRVTLSFENTQSAGGERPKARVKGVFYFTDTGTYVRATQA